MVCQRFFLNSLGPEWNNDKIIRKAFADFDPSQPNTFLSEVVKDRRGNRVLTHKIDHSIIKADIGRYQPAVPHYRRYLPSDLTLEEMYDALIETGQVNITSQMYHRVLKSMNISFAKPRE